MFACIKDCIESEDPLSDAVFDYLVGYHEETDLIDFKVAFENEEKAWLDVTKDVLAFSNTHGGYLIYGIKNATFEIVGLASESLRFISDADSFMKKINRFVEPPVNLIRCKIFKIGDKDLVAIFIPPSRDKTHLVSKDASFSHVSGDMKVVLRLGTTYVRQSAGNHLMDSRGMDDIVNRRLSYFKQTLLENITKVVEAPRDSGVFILSEDKSNPENTTYIIQDGPNAIPIKGMSFSISPTTIEQEIAGWMAMSSREAFAIPSVEITWRWYRERESINLSVEQRLWIARCSLLTTVPAFYWLRGTDAASINAMLIDALSNNDNMVTIENIVSTGAFLGARFHQKLISHIGKFAKRLSPTSKTIPHDGPKLFFRANIPRPNPVELKNELNFIADSSKERKNHIPILRDRYRAQALDCFLYAQDNHYIN